MSEENVEVVRRYYEAEYLERAAALTAVGLSE
jgi:hypothetical protein